METQREKEVTSPAEPLEVGGSSPDGSGRRSWKWEGWKRRAGPHRRGRSNGVS